MANSKAGPATEHARRTASKVGVGRSGSASRPAPGARERSRKLIHDEIYSAAMRLFKAHGYEDVTVDEICTEAGVSKATFFRYFASKFGLVDEFNQRIAAKIDAAINIETMTGAECLRLATRIMHDEWAHAAPQMRSLAFEFLQAGVSYQPVSLAAPMARNLVTTLVEVVKAGQKRGEFNGTVAPHLIAPLIVFGWTISTLQWFDHTDKAEYKKAIMGVIDLQLAGLQRARSGSN